jgi:uncharacterized protein YdhG (YjbR/CyaY superfamily)
MNKTSHSPKPFEKYVTTLHADQRAALQKVWKAIKLVIPEAQEGVSYGLPAFLLNGKGVAALSASKQHCSYFPMSGRVVASLAKELKSYDTSKGTIRFLPNKPLPTALIKKLVKARLAEIKGHAKTTNKTNVKKHATGSENPNTDAAVITYLKKLDHPLKKDMEAARKIILDVSPDICEGIKWNVPSFYTTDYFATFHVRATDSVQLIFHTGAKVKETAKTGLKIADPHGLIKWLAKDRCLLTLGKGQQIQANRKAFEEIVRQWITNLC